MNRNKKSTGLSPSIVLSIKYMKGKEKVCLFGSNIFSIEADSHPYINQIKNHAEGVFDDSGNINVFSYLNMIKSFIKNEIVISGVRIYFEKIYDITKNKNAIKSTTKWTIIKADPLKSSINSYDVSPIDSFTKSQIQKNILECEFDNPIKVDGDTYILLECHRDMVITFFIK